MFNLLTIIVDAIHCWRWGDGMAETGERTRDAAEGDGETGVPCRLLHALACRSVEEDNQDQ